MRVFIDLTSIHPLADILSDMTGGINLFTKLKRSQYKVAKRIPVIFLSLFGLWAVKRFIYEGLFLSSKRSFNGDFTASMFTFRDTPGVGVLYGPVFSLEQALTRRYSELVDTNFYAALNIFLLVAIIIFCLSSIRANKFASLFVVVLILAFNPTTYAVSVAANPEFIELTLLCCCWYSISRKNFVLPWILIPTAILTKVIPLIFLPILVTKIRIQRIMLSVLVSSGIVMATVANAQIPLLQVIKSFINPNLPTGINISTPASELVINPPLSYQVLGLSSALCRVDDSQILANCTDQNFAKISILVFILHYLAFIVFFWTHIRKLELQPSQIQVHSIFAILFAMMPLATPNAHPHTFIFLLPCIAAIYSIVQSQKKHKSFLTVVFLILYIIIGAGYLLSPLQRVSSINFMNIWIFKEPIIANLILVEILIALLFFNIKESIRSFHD